MSFNLNCSPTSVVIFIRVKGSSRKEKYALCLSTPSKTVPVVKRRGKGREGEREGWMDVVYSTVLVCTVLIWYKELYIIL